MHQCVSGDPKSCNGYYVVYHGEVCPSDKVCIYRDSFGEDELFQLFPLPKRTGLFQDSYGEDAKPGNASYFYRDIYDNSNERKDITTDYILTGGVKKNIETIQLFWDGAPTTPEQIPINPNDHSFILEINLRKGNLCYGENTYLLRGNAKGLYYERILRVFLLDPYQKEKKLISIENFNGK